MKEIEELKQEIMDFFKSDKEYIKNNMEILDSILWSIYNLHR